MFVLLIIIRRVPFIIQNINLLELLSLQKPINFIIFILCSLYFITVTVSIYFVQSKFKVLIIK